LHAVDGSPFSGTTVATWQGGFVQSVDIARRANSDTGINVRADTNLYATVNLKDGGNIVASARVNFPLLNPIPQGGAAYPLGTFEVGCFNPITIPTYTSIEVIPESAGNGSGAVFTTEVVTQKVIACDVINGGTGYAATAPSVSLTYLPGGIPTTVPNIDCTPVIVDGSITEIRVTGTGLRYNYFTEAPTVVISTGTAKAVANLTPRRVSGIKLTQPGSNYFPPSVTITGNGSGARARANVVDGVVESITILDQGKGYTGTIGVVIDTPSLIGGKQAFASATLIFNLLQRIQVLSGGSGYDTSAVVFTGGGGTGLSGSVSIKDGQIVAAKLLSPGGGYTSYPDISVSGTGSGAVLGLIINPKNPRKITHITVDTPGAGYSNDTVELEVVGGGGSGAAAEAYVVNGAIRGGRLLSKGQGYTSAPTIEVKSISGNGASLRARLVGGKVLGITLTNGGSGYETAPTVELIGDGTGAKATAFMNPDNVGEITSVIITDGGAGYIDSPLLTFSLPTGRPSSLSVVDFPRVLGRLSFVGYSSEGGSVPWGKLTGIFAVGKAVDLDGRYFKLIAPTGQYYSKVNPVGAMPKGAPTDPVIKIEPPSYPGGPSRIVLEKEGSYYPMANGVSEIPITIASRFVDNTVMLSTPITKCTVVQGEVVKVNFETRGSGYLSAPTITFTAPPYSLSMLLPTVNDAIDLAMGLTSDPAVYHAYIDLDAELSLSYPGLSTLDGTYARGTGVITVTQALHGLRDGQAILFVATSGDADDIQSAAVTVIDENSYSIVQAGAVTTGACTIRIHRIISSNTFTLRIYNDLG
jgi:hypothetical protein